MAGDGKDILDDFFFSFLVHRVLLIDLLLAFLFSFPFSHHHKVLPVKLSVLVLVKFFLSSDEAFAFSFHILILLLILHRGHGFCHRLCRFLSCFPCTLFYIYTLL